MKEIKLSTEGYVALVDDENYDKVKNIKWYALITKGKVYAHNKIYGYMHRFLFIEDESDEIDHKDDNGLNNQRENIRVTDRSHNIANRKGGGRGESKYRGVWLRVRMDRPGPSKWIAEITVNYQKKYLGSFKTEQEAAIAWNEAAYEAWGEAAVLNEVGKL